MLSPITDENYTKYLDRFDELWVSVELSSDMIEEIEALADLISAFEQKRYPIMNDPSYRDLLNVRKRNGKL